MKEDSAMEKRKLSHRLTLITRIRKENSKKAISSDLHVLIRLIRVNLWLIHLPAAPLIPCQDKLLQQYVSEELKRVAMDSPRALNNSVPHPLSFYQARRTTHCAP